MLVRIVAFCLFLQIYQLALGAELHLGANLNTRFAFTPPSYPNNDRQFQDVDARIYLQVKQELERQRKVTALVALKNNNLLGNLARNELLIDQIALQYESPYGQLNLGMVPSAASILKVSASDLAGGAGGINGYWTDYVPFGGYFKFIEPEDKIPYEIDVPLYLKPRLPSENVVPHYRYSNKITWISPKIKNFQFAMSFAPNEQQYAKTSTERLRDGPLIHVNKFGSSFSLAAVKTKEAKDKIIKKSIGIEKIELHNHHYLAQFGAKYLTAIHTGTSYQKGRVTLTHSRGKWMAKSDFAISRLRYISYGARFELKNSFASFTSTKISNPYYHLVVRSVTYDYTPFPGMVLYNELTNFKFNTSPSLYGAFRDSFYHKKGHSYLFIAGIKLNF